MRRSLGVFALLPALVLASAVTATAAPSTGSAPAPAFVEIHKIGPVLKYQLQTAVGDEQQDAGVLRVMYTCYPSVDPVMRSASLEVSVRVPGMAGAGFWNDKYGEEIVCDGTRRTVALHLARPVEMPFTPSAKHATADVQVLVLGCIHCANDPFYRGAQDAGTVRVHFVGW